MPTGEMGQLVPVRPVTYFACLFRPAMVNCLDAFTHNTNNYCSARRAS
jgi:hypothetical protein